MSVLVSLVGPAISHHGVVLTRDEYRSLQNLYGFRDEDDGFLQAGADRNMLRCAAEDGFRILAWIAKFAPPGEDPLKIVIDAAMHVGWDVDPDDAAWATGEEG